jgi:RNA polymerase sigma factor (TIGR02999 family)
MEIIRVMSSPFATWAIIDRQKKTARPATFLAVPTQPIDISEPRGPAVCGKEASGATSMSATTSTNVTDLLVAWSQGDEGSFARLVPLIYDELRRISSSYMRRERRDHTLQTTAVVHEAFLRLAGQRVTWQSRAHFFGIAAQMMRRVLLDHAKACGRAKRGGQAIKLPLESRDLAAPSRSVDLLELDGALSRLERIDPLRGRVVELRFFGGLSNEQASDVLGISAATVQRRWAGAKAWLYHELTHCGK